MRRSRTGKWRAFSLLSIHVLILAHVLHWLRTGETVTPVEPSEAMETIRTGRLNAGFIFFAVAILLTAVLGRFVCGWGCHLVAYQDLTGWIMKKLHWRPKAFRSRLLVFVPLVAAFYMFLWPAVLRFFLGVPHPRPTLHLSRTGFWDTFPGLGVAVLTVLVCGMAIVVFLGQKGFCTYACPYGAFFGLADKIALGRIRVTDACNQCGHCTATCTSNVDVAQEVRLYRMVVDPGCMKCLDCVSVCPNDALYWGLGRPALHLKPAAAPRAPRYDLGPRQEWLALGIFAAAFFCYRGLYGQIPFLLSLGMAGIFVYLVFKTAALFTQPDVQLQKLKLKAAGKQTVAGRAFCILVAGVIALTVHSGVWRYHDYLGQSAAELLSPEWVGWPYQRAYFAQLTPEQRAAADEAHAHFEACRKLGLVASPESEGWLAWLKVYLDQPQDALAMMQSLAGGHPANPRMRLKLAAYQVNAGQTGAAEKTYRDLLADMERERALPGRKKDRPLPLAAQVWTEWSMFLSSQGREEEAEAALARAVQEEGRSTIVWTATGNAQLARGSIDEGRRSYIRALQCDAENFTAAAALERIGKADQRFDEAVADYDATLRKDPDRLVFLVNRAFALARLARYADSIAAYRDILRLHPQALTARADLGAVLLANQDLPGALKEYELLAEQAPENGEVALKLGFLYQQAGRPADARRAYEKALAVGSETERAEAQRLRAALPAGG